VLTNFSVKNTKNLLLTNFSVKNTKNLVLTNFSVKNFSVNKIFDC